MGPEQNTEQAEVIQKVEVVETPTLTPEERLTNFFEQEEQDQQQAEYEAFKERAVDEARQKESEPDADEEAFEEVEAASDEQEAGSELDTDIEDTDAASEVSEDEEFIHLDTLSDAAEHMGVEVADLYQLKVPVTLDNGDKVEISIGEWKDNVHTLIKQERESFIEQAKTVETQLEQHKEHLNHQLQQATAMVQAMETELTGDINGVDWQKLRTENPGEYSAMMSEYEAKVKRLETHKQQIAESMTQQQQEQQEQWQQHRAERLEHENRMLLDNVPSWVNEDKRNAETQQIGDYLANVGFTPEETGSIMDHRFIRIARDAMMYNQMDKSSPAKKKIVKMGKKTVKPGAKQSKSQQETAARKAQMDAFKKGGGSVDDAADLFKSLGL